MKTNGLGIIAAICIGVCLVCSFWNASEGRDVSSAVCAFAGMINVFYLAINIE